MTSLYNNLETGFKQALLVLKPKEKRWSNIFGAATNNLKYFR